MSNSKKIARIAGPTIIVLTVSETLNYHIWETNIPPVTYLNGMLLFIAGIAIIRDHNRWKPNWTVLVTLSGWFGIFLGLFRVFFPEAKQAPPGFGIYAGLFLLLVMGILLTIKAFGREDDSGPKPSQ